MQPQARVSSEEACGCAQVHVEPTEDGGVTVRVSGDLDVASAPLVEDALVAHATRRDPVRVNLSAVSFCDCAGLSALLASDRALRAAGRRLRFVCLSAPVRRLLVLTRMDHVLALDRLADE
jgi:anti-anti-sigma factor